VGGDASQTLRCYRNEGRTSERPGERMKEESSVGTAATAAHEARSS